jgi:cytochrome c-type biogenesis protein
VIDAPLALAFTTGMVATVNPCGFAMLPAYLSFFIGIEDRNEDDPRASVWRALVVGLAVTIGFAATFAVVGLVVSRVTRSVYDVAPWISLVIGAALVVFGIALLAGFEFNVRTPRLDRGGKTRGLLSMGLFGVSYAVASLGCELPIFLAAISGVFGRGLTSGIAYFIAFALGFGVILVSLTVALAMARQSLVHGLRRVLPFVSRIAGGLLVVTGAYVAWYGSVEIRNNADDATVTKVTDWSARLADSITRSWNLLAVVLAAVVVGAAVYVWFGRGRLSPVSESGQREPDAGGEHARRDAAEHGDRRAAGVPVLDEAQRLP